jgi:type II restriction enzyme
MASSIELSAARKQHTSKYKESDIRSLKADAQFLTALLEKKYAGTPFSFTWEPIVFLKGIVDELKKNYPDKEFEEYDEKANFRPNGGVIYLHHKTESYPVLISEIKKQGTNDKQREMDMPDQPLGNAIERLAKNIKVSNLMCASLPYNCFVCFGYGCDFTPGSNMMDRVSSMNDMFKLNTFHIDRSKYTPFAPTSLFFRVKPFSKLERTHIMLQIVAECLRLKGVDTAAINQSVAA